MSYVIDFYGNGPDSASLKPAGVSGCMFYVVGGSSNKHGTLAHVRAVMAAGVSVGFVNEVGVNDVGGGYNAGFAHARDGLAEATRLTGHPARCIYLACDEQVPWSSAASYWRGGRDAVGAARLGAYGPRVVVAGAFSAGYIRYGWQPEAWSTGVDPRVQLHQHTQYIRVGGVQCDFNQIMHADYGQYPYAGAPVPPKPGPPKPPVPPAPIQYITNVERYFTMV